VRTPVGVFKEPESYDLTVRYTGRDGNAPASSGSALTSVDDGTTVHRKWNGSGDAGRTVVLRLPRRQYRLTASIVTGDGATGSITLLARAAPLLLDRPTTVEMDARTGQPVSVTVPDASTSQVHAHVAVTGHTVNGRSFDRMFLGRIGPDVAVDGFRTEVGGQWAKLDANNVEDLYVLMYPVRGRVPAGYQRTVAHRDLARVQVDTAATGTGTVGVRRVRSAVLDNISGTSGPFLNIRVPSVRTEFYNTEAQVAFTADSVELFDGGGNQWTTGTTYTTYRRGKEYRELYNRGVFGPAGATAPDPNGGGVTRSGDVVLPGVGPFTDGAGRPGTGDPATVTTTLWRDGTELASEDGFEFHVPAAEAAYRLRVEAARAAPFELSTGVRTEWTFRSGHVDADTYLPLWTVLVAPPLDRHNTAPAGRTVAVPVRFVPQPGSGTGTLRSRTVEVSFDDGGTWHPVRLTGDVAPVAHPAGAGFVSVRATAADDRGNTVHHTVIRAYRFG
jgi:hypothetical protein